jgi:hypothetical protein
MFIHDQTIQNVVYIVAGIGNLLMLGCLVAVLLNWNSALIRASSRVFMVLMLVLISIMLSGSVLYAWVPASDQSYICHLRPWFTCISIMGVLAGNQNNDSIDIYNILLLLVYNCDISTVFIIIFYDINILCYFTVTCILVLTAKTNRIRNIFASKELSIKQVTNKNKNKKKNFKIREQQFKYFFMLNHLLILLFVLYLCIVQVTDFDILQIVLLFLFVQSIMLIGFSAGSLSSAELAIGKGSAVDKFVNQCSHANKFME